MQHCTSLALTNDNESGGLEELLIVPGGMFSLQDVTHSVVLPQPEGGVHGETWHDSKKLLTNGQLTLWREALGIHHVHGHIRHSGGIHLSIHYLNRKTNYENSVNTVLFTKQSWSPLFTIWLTPKLTVVVCIKPF